MSPARQAIHPLHPWSIHASTYPPIAPSPPPSVDTFIAEMFVGPLLWTGVGSGALGVSKMLVLIAF